MPTRTRRPRRKRIKQTNNWSARRPALSAAFRDSTILETVVLVGLVIAAAIVLWTYQFISSRLEEGDATNNDGSGSAALPRVLEPLNPAKSGGQLRGSSTGNNNSEQTKSTTGGYAHFLKVAQDLSALNPDETLSRLERDDPFGTQAFDKQLLEHETTLGRVLSIDEIQEIFPCPSNEERITLPDYRVEQKAREFRDGKRGTFLFFQHLRKAG